MKQFFRPVVVDFLAGFPTPTSSGCRRAFVQDELLTFLVMHQSRVLVAHKGRWGRIYNATAYADPQALWWQPVSAGGARGWRRC
ncbi:MAG: hypothetical protein ACLQU3_19070 [Limisphaerales bacterium]